MSEEQKAMSDSILYSGQSLHNLGINNLLSKYNG